MEEAVRPYQAPPPAPGYRTPAVSGINTGEATTTFGQTDNGQTDLGPFARVDEPEDYSWWPRLRMLLAGTQEVTSEWKDVSTSFQIDPNACSVWRLRCQSASLSISFVALESPSWISRLILWKDVKRVATVEIIVDWQTAASGTRTFSLSGVSFPGGEAPEWTATTGRDAVIVQITSDSEKYGFAAGLDMRVPS